MGERNAVKLRQCKECGRRYECTARDMREHSDACIRSKGKS